MLVIHKTPLVADDLREMLMSVGAAEVELARALPEMPPKTPFDTCFLSVSAQNLDMGLLEQAARIASHVVLIIGFMQARPDLPPHFSVLSEPFRDRDVRAAILAARRGGAPSSGAAAAGSSGSGHGPEP
jgi:hypothetical protein